MCKTGRKFNFVKLSTDAWENKRILSKCIILVCELVTIKFHQNDAIFLDVMESKYFYSRKEKIFCMIIRRQFKAICWAFNFTLIEIK